MAEPGMQPAEPNVSIIIVNYNSGDLLGQCIKSIIDNINYPYEIIIFDNNSTDKSLENCLDCDQKKNIRVISSSQNIGFAKANNLATAKARGHWLHYLNPDIIVNSKLAGHYRGIEKINAIYVTSLVDSFGNSQKTTHLIPTMGNLLSRVVRPAKSGYWSIGASVIMSKDTFDILGGWPEDNFMYAEDLDLFYKAHCKNIKVVYLDSKLIHFCQGCTKTRWDEEQRAELIEKAYYGFYAKYGIVWQYYIVRTIQLIFIFVTGQKTFAISLRAFGKQILKSFK